MSDGERNNTEEGLKMEEDSPISRVERTFWTVWSYITGAVNRFFRPEPTDITSNDPNSMQESAVDSEPANFGHAEGDTSGGGVDEEQHLATASLLSSSRPLVGWELCTAEINLGPDEESVQCKTQLSRASEEGEGTREEQLGRAGNDDAGLFFAQDDKQEENEDQKLRTRRQDKTPENGEDEERANARSLKTTGDAVSEDVETERAVTLDDPPKMDEVKEAEGKMQHEDDRDLQVEDSEIKLCPTADLTLDEEDNTHVEEANVQRNEVDTAVMHEEVENSDDVPQLASESESDEGARQAEHQLSVCEESSDNHRDFKQDPGFSPLHVELQMTCDKSSIVSEDELTAVEQEHVMAHRSESDEVEDMKEEEDENALDVSEAANKQTVDEAPEQEDDIKTVTEDILIEHVTCREEVMQNTPEQEEDIKTVRVDTLTEHVTCREEVMQHSPEQEDDILTEHVTHSDKVTQSAPEQEDEIKTATEDIITKHVVCNEEFVLNVPEQDDDITTITEDILTEHVTCSEEVTQSAPEQEDDILTEHVTNSEGFVQDVLEQEDDIKIVTEDILSVTRSEEFMQEDGILTEHVTCSEEAVQSSPEQEDDIKLVTEDILTEYVTRSDKVTENAPEQEEDVKTLTEDILTEHVTCSVEAVQNAPEQEDDIKTLTEDSLTEHVTGSEEVMQNFLEQDDDIETVTEDDILTEHVTCSEEFVQNSSEQGNDFKTATEDSLTEHVTRSEEVMQNSPELEEEIKTVTEDILTEHVTNSEGFVQGVLEQEDDIKTVTEDILSVTRSEEFMQEDGILTEHVTRSEEAVQNSPEQEDDIKLVTEDILIEHVTRSDEVTENAPEQEEDIKTVTEDILTEHVTCSVEAVQNAPEQEDVIKTVTEDILTEHITCSEEVMQNTLEQEEEIKTVTEDDILTEHVTCSEEFVQNSLEQGDDFKTAAEDILTEHVTRSDEVTLNFLEQDDDIKTVTEDDILTEHVTHSDKVTQSAPEQEDDIKTVTEDIITKHVRNEEFLLNAPEQDDDITTVTEDILTEHVTCSEEVTQSAPEQEDDILTEHVTNSEGFVQDVLEQEDDITTVTEDILTEHVTHGVEAMQNAPTQEDDIETATEDTVIEHVTCSEEAVQSVPEQEDDIKTVTVDDILTEHVTHSEEVVLNAESELHTADFANGEQEDVAEDTEVQTKTRETDDVETESHGSLIDNNSDVTTHTSADDSFFAQVEEERLSSEAVNEESDMEMACTATSVMDIPEGKTGQEMSGEFKNIPQGLCEGRVVVSEELNSPTCEETREGVPEYNNEPDENTTQRFLEDGDYEEIQGSPLPEEVESKEPESLQNSGWSTGADCLLMREHMEEGQGVKDSFGLVVEDHTETLWFTDAGMPQETEKPLVEAVIEGSGHLFEVEEGELLVDLMKTEIEQKTEKESESYVDSTNKNDEATKELQDGTEELLVELEKDEELCDSKVAVAAGVGWETTGALAGQEVLTDDTLLEAEVQKTTETSYFQELVDAINLEQNSHLTPSLLGDVTESESLKHSDETEPKLPEDVELQDEGLEVEEAGYGDEEEAAADEMQSRNEMEIFHLQATEMAESELSGPTQSLETKNQQSDEALDEMLPEAADESMTARSKSHDLILISTEDTAKHTTTTDWSFTEETVSSISGRQDVIDEDILDLWIQTALSKDNDGIQRQEGPEPGQQTEPSNEEQGETSSAQTDKDKEQLVDLVSDTEMSSSTVESGFLDQSLGEWGTQSSETQLPKSTSTSESFQGLHNMLVNMSESADISEFSAQRSDFLMEETAETDLKQEESITATGFHPDSGVTSPEAGDLNQEFDKSRDETEEEEAEAEETETGSQKEIAAEEAELAKKTDWKDTDEADVKSEETKTEDEPLEMSDSLDEMKHTESGRSGSSSEASIEEGVVLTESGSQGDTCTESERKLSTLPTLDEPQPRRSEDVAESVAGVEVAEEPTTKSEDEMEVDTFALDFTVQRSRIAVKNPRVRRPKDPRSLLHMPSLDPTPSLPRPAKVPAGVPLGGLGIGIKLPGLGAGFPVLKKTQRAVRDENKPETSSEETKPEEKSDTPTQDEAPQRPKWMPPKHPGFGNPLMSELKSKLKKTSNE